MSTTTPVSLKRNATPPIAPATTSHRACLVSCHCNSASAANVVTNRMYHDGIGAG